MGRTNFFLLLGAGFFYLSVYAGHRPASCNALLGNISRPGTLPGTVVASTSQNNPNYYYHWVRDASLVMYEVLHLLIETNQRLKVNPTVELAVAKSYYERILTEFFAASKFHQQKKAQSGLGEPKFNVDGTAFNDQWGRPQNDGPALRARIAARYAHELLDSGKTPEEIYFLYDPQSAQSLIKADLEYTSHHWNDPSFDIWEETLGTHFYNLLVSRRALLEGAELAERLKDEGAANWYRQQAQGIEPMIKKFYGPEGWIRAHLEEAKGPKKDSNLDVQVILGVLHSSPYQRRSEFYDVDHPAVISTAFHFLSTYEKLFPKLNEGHKGLILGRYSEDHYDGYTTDGKGNGWVISSYAFAEYFYLLADKIRGQGSITIDERTFAFFNWVTSRVKGSLPLQQGKTYLAGFPPFSKLLVALEFLGDAFVARVDDLAGTSGEQNEQIHFETGKPQGAPNLTWNSAAYLSAMRGKAFFERASLSR